MNHDEAACIRMIAANWQIDAHDVPVVLAKWCTFEQQYGEYYVKLAIMKDSLTFWSDNPLFYNRFYLFSDYTASFDQYAIWHNGSHQSLSEMPIVALGDDGYLGVIADNLPDFLRMLASGDLLSARNRYDTDDIEVKRFCLPLEWLPFEADDLPPNWSAFHDFIQNELHLTPDPEPNTSLMKAYSKYSSDFIQWCNQYLDWKIDEPASIIT